MASSVVRTCPSTPTSPPLMSGASATSPYGTRSASKRKNLEANFAAATAKKYLSMQEIDHLVVYKEGVSSANPSDLFYFVALSECKWLPHFIVANKGMTPVERCKRVLLEGDGMTLDCKIFARIEKGKLHFVTDFFSI